MSSFKRHSDTNESICEFMRYYYNILRGDVYEEKSILTATELSRNLRPS